MTLKVSSIEPFHSKCELFSARTFKSKNWNASWQFQMVKRYGAERSDFRHGLIPRQSRFVDEKSMWMAAAQLDNYDGTNSGRHGGLYLRRSNFVVGHIHGSREARKRACTHPVLLSPNIYEIIASVLKDMRRENCSFLSRGVLKGIYSSFSLQRINPAQPGRWSSRPTICTTPTTWRGCKDLPACCRVSRSWTCLALIA